MSIAALVLAAGLSTRMGAPKPLLDIDGTPSLARVLAAIDEAGVDPVVIVLGRDADLVSSRIDLRRRVVIHNPSPERGLSSSLKLGLAAIPPAASGVLVFHADMPFVRADTVCAVSALAEAGASLAAPSYRGARGFPVFLSRDCFAPLQSELQGDSGAREFIERRRAGLRLVDVADPGCVRDLDRPEDLARCGRRTSWTTCA